MTNWDTPLMAHLPSAIGPAILFCCLVAIVVMIAIYGSAHHAGSVGAEKRRVWNNDGSRGAFS
jgi:hypothetical protein